MKAARAVATMLVLLLLAGASDLPLAVAPPRPQECGSVVIMKCDRPEPAAGDRASQQEARRLEQRRVERATMELDRIIIEGEAERGESPEHAISRVLSRPLLRQGENSFAIGESAQCSCRNICPPPPLPCCQCTDRVGSRHATSPGWKPTH